MSGAMRLTLFLVVAVTGLAAAACSTETQTTTTLDVAPLASIQLGNNGLGDVLLGLDPDSVVADISARFGAPDHDSGWIAASPNIYGSCPGETMRAIGWGSLVTIFVDDGAGLGGYFYTYTYGYDYAENAGGIDPRALDLVTNDGIGLGSTVAAARTAFGDVDVAGDEALNTWTFESDSAGLRGLLSGSSAADTITLIEPTIGCD